MPINTRKDYIEIGTSVIKDSKGNFSSLANTLLLPVPVELPSNNEFLADAWRNADGSLTYSQIGRTQYKTQIKWNRLPNKKWWEINRWFESHGYLFYMRYFSHTDGKVKVHRFYRGNIESATPSTTTEVIDGITVPTHYKSCGFSIIDVGDDDVYVTQTLGVR